MSGTSDAQTNRDAALFLSAFVDELESLGVTDAVVSPGSRSTPLAMVLDASDVQVHLDIDERGAGFFALGMAKAQGRPVCLVCTSGTAVANYHPALLEADTSRVPLIVLTGDRPHELRNLGAPQTADQIKVFGDAVRFFNEMPIPSSSPSSIAYARQMAFEAYVRATGELPGPVHLNFPFAEPLKPDLQAEGLFETGRRSGEGADAKSPLLVSGTRVLSPSQVASIAQTLAGQRGVILCGEGSYPESIVEFARLTGFPLIADPLSNLRNLDDAFVIDSYDNIFGSDRCPAIDVTIRFGRWPVSKRCFKAFEADRPFQVVVDEAQTRDFNADTDLFVRCSPAGFIESFLGASADGDVLPASPFAPDGYAREWACANVCARTAIEQVRCDPGSFEGPFIEKMLDLIPARSLLFSASSMSIRALDTFMLAPARDLTVMCNRGLNGIDGTLSSALGAATGFEAATLLIGDLALLHDVNALHLARELSWLDEHSFVIMLSDNGGGGIFDFLPQKSSEPYFERLFLTPQTIGFSGIAQGFGVRYARPADVAAFSESYRRAIEMPGITLIDIVTPLDGLAGFYAPYQRCDGEKGELK